MALDFLPNYVLAKFSENKVLFSLEQIGAWHTFHVFLNRKRVPIERSFGVIPFILIPEMGQRNTPYISTMGGPRKCQLIHTLAMVKGG